MPWRRSILSEIKSSGLLLKRGSRVACKLTYVDPMDSTCAKILSHVLSREDEASGEQRVVSRDSTLWVLSHGASFFMDRLPLARPREFLISVLDPGGMVLGIRLRDQEVVSRESSWIRPVGELGCLSDLDCLLISQIFHGEEPWDFPV